LTLRLVRTGLGVAGAAALLALVPIVAIQGPDATGPAVRAFLDGIGGSELALGTTLAQATPILLIGLAATIAFRAGLFDIGQPGQFVLGGLVAGAIAPVAPGPGWMAVLVGLGGGMLVGGAWANLVARFVAATDIELVIASLVANYLADGTAKLLVTNAFRDHSAFGFVATKQLNSSERLPELITGTGLHAGAFLALAAFVAAAWAIPRTAPGHRLRLFGRQPAFAALAGTRPQRYRRRVLSLSGMLCGLAGAMQVVGVFGRYLDGSLGGPDSVAWTGLTLAIMVPAGIVALLPGAVLLAAVQTGVAGVQRDLGVAIGLATVIQATILVAVAFSSRSVVGSGVSRSRRRALHAQPTSDSPAAQAVSPTDNTRPDDRSAHLRRSVV
jgi:general nucleoside transport system permease protein